MTKKEKEIKMYWDSMTKQVVEAAESYDTYKLESLAQEIAIYAKKEGISVPAEIKENLKKSKVELPVLPIVSHEKYSILPWVKKRQQAEYENRIRFAIRLKDEKLLQGIIEIYESELNDLARGYKLDNTRFKQIRYRYNELQRQARKEYGGTHSQISFIEVDFSKKNALRQKQIAEAKEILAYKNKVEQDLGDRYGRKFTREEQIYWIKELAKARAAGKKMVTKYLTAVVGKYCEKLKEQELRRTEGVKRGEEIRAQAAAKTRDDAHQAEKRRNEKAERDRKEREEDIQRSANRDNGMPYGSW